MKKRVWVRSGVVEALDSRQEELLKRVYAAIVRYYSTSSDLERKKPLSLSALMRLTNRSSYAVSLALKVLANSVPEGYSGQPSVWYERIPLRKNSSKRVYRISLRKS